MLNHTARFYVLAAFLCGWSSHSRAGDWPRWNGPTADGRVPSADLVDAIPEDGLPLAWETAVGLGYSGPVISDGILVVSDYVRSTGQVTNNAGRRDELEGRERIRAYDAVTGRPLWEHAYERAYALSYPGGPRATPTVADRRVYCLGAEGDLVCLSLDKGELLWDTNFAEEYGTKTPIWGHAASPLVLGNQVICMAGKRNGLVISFDAETGEELWQSLDGNDVGYCPPRLIRHDGSDQLLVWSPTQLASLDPADGTVNWRQPVEPDYGMSILPPLHAGDRLFVSGEGVSKMFALSPGASHAKLLWEGRPSTSMMLATSTAIFDDGHLYGADLKSGALMCVRAEDGARLWRTAKPTINSDRERGGAHGSAFLMKHNDTYFILAENGDVISAKLSPTGYEETGRFHAIDPTNQSMGRSILWTYPAIAAGHLYVRNDRVLRCFSLSP